MTEKDNSSVDPNATGNTSSAASSGSRPPATNSGEPDSESGSDGDGDGDGKLARDAIYRQLVPCGEEFEREMFSIISENGDDENARQYVSKVANMHEDSSELDRHGRKFTSDELVQANLRLPVWVARNFADRGVPIMQLIEAGNEGLKKAAEKYDADRGYQFSVYAMWFVRQNITLAVSGQHRRGSDASHHQIQHSREYDDRTVFSEPEPEPEVLRKNSAPDLSNVLSREALDAMTKLTPRERDVLRMRFGLDDGQKRSVEEVAEFYGMTCERVRQIEAKAMQKLKPVHRARRIQPVRRAPIKRIGRGQFLAVLAKLDEFEAEVMRFKWGFFDGQIRTIADTAEKFAMSQEEVEALEAKALKMVSDG